MCKVFTAASDPAMRRHIRAALPAGCASVGEARDAESAMSMLRDLRPDVLIADADLPFTDGLALSGFVRRAFPWIRVILLSGHDDARHRRMAEELGVHEYLLKPVRLYELSEALQRAAASLKTYQQTLYGEFLRADRLVSPERREHERSLAHWLRTGAMPPDAAPLPCAGRYCRMLTFSRADGDHAGIFRGVLRLMERDSAGLFAIDLPSGPAMAVADDDPVHLESLAYGAAYSACLAAERFAGARILAQVSRQAENLGQLRDGWLECRRLAQTQPENRSVLGVEDADCAGLIDRAQTYIGENCARPGLSAAQTARMLGLTPAHLCVLFEQETGRSFTEYLLGLRISRARQLLTDTRTRISAVAAQVGFDETDAFAAAFTRLTGITPQNCRKLAKC